MLQLLFSLLPPIYLHLIMDRTGFGKLRKVMEIDTAIFQESFGKEKCFNGYGKVLDFCLGKF